jgi:hypothetical protein
MLGLARLAKVANCKWLPTLSKHHQPSIVVLIRFAFSFLGRATGASRMRVKDATRATIRSVASRSHASARVKMSVYIAPDAGVIVLSRVRRRVIRSRCPATGFTLTWMPERFIISMLFLRVYLVSFFVLS